MENIEEHLGEKMKQRHVDHMERKLEKRTMVAGAARSEAKHKDK